MKSNLEIFKSLFKGREEVFAIRWEKGGRSGYSPAYDMNWTDYQIHKARGGTLKDYNAKEYAALTEQSISNHLSGKEIIGIYPLLKENTTWFIAADFDQSESGERSWILECRAFIQECKKYGLPVYLERSRSGAGGHVWLFFEAPYPAIKSRQIFKQLLASAGVTPEKHTQSNFDRFFPNQDELSGKGLGNLIALPLQKKAMEGGNACFIDPENEIPFPDQWAILSGIQKVSSQVLDEVIKIIAGNVPDLPALSDFQTGVIPVVLSNEIILPKLGLPLLLRKFITDNLVFANADYFIKKNTGKNTFGSEMYFDAAESRDNMLSLPRGIAGKLLRYCNENKIAFQLDDKRVKLEAVKFKSSIALHEYQQIAVLTTDKKDFGVIVAPPGSGKTVMALQIIAKKQQPALIIVHRKQLFTQWLDRIETFLGIPKFQIGRLDGNNYEVGELITVAMIQSLQAVDLNKSVKLYHSFGTIIVDECHHIPAKTFRSVIRNFHSYYLYGLTATPVRKNKDERLIFTHLGDIIYEVIIPATEAKHKALSVVIRNTELDMPFNAATDKIETLINILIHDTARNEIIKNDIYREVKTGRKILVLTERKSHVTILYQYVKSFCEAIMLTGDDDEHSRKSKLQLVTDGDFEVLISTGQFIGEGVDIEALNCLILAYPFSFEGKLIQYIGRVQRNRDAPVIYDYRDTKIDYFNNQFKQRNRYYRKQMKAGKLKAMEELILTFEGAFFSIDQTDTFLSITCLELPLLVEEFKTGVIWKLRVNDYNIDEGELFADIIDYSCPLDNVTVTQHEHAYFSGIDKIRFRSLDTAGLLRSVILQRQLAPILQPPTGDEKQLEMIEQVFLKTMKVPFWKIHFGYGNVSFPIFINEFNQELTFEIENPDIRPEFAAVRDYFSKILKKKTITVDIVIRYNQNQILSTTAMSEDISQINNRLIESVRFELIKREIFRGQSLPTEGKAIQTMSELLGKYAEQNQLFASQEQFMNDILNIRESKHYFQLKFLAAKHEASILKLRFVVQPFSFLFLLTGEKKYHIIWETLDTEDATYMWHTEKTRDSLKTLLSELENILEEIKQHGRQVFLDKDNGNFSKIVHDYSNLKKGFVIWKASLEDKLV